MLLCKYLETENYTDAIFAFCELLYDAGWNVYTSGKWVLLTHSNKQLLIERGKKESHWWVSYSNTACFKNGSKSIRPEAKDEVRIIHNNHGKPFEFDKGVKIQNWYFGAIKDTGFFYFVATQADNKHKIIMVNDEKMMYQFNGSSKYEVKNGAFRMFNWCSSEVYDIKVTNLPTGSIFNDKLVAEQLLLPWNLGNVRPELIVDKESKPKLNPSPAKPPIKVYTYKMIGKYLDNGEVKYHGWIVKGAPDFEGKESKMPGVTDIYVADRWKK